MSFSFHIFLVRKLSGNLFNMSVTLCDATAMELGSFTRKKFHFHFR